MILGSILTLSLGLAFSSCSQQQEKGCCSKVKKEACCDKTEAEKEACCTKDSVIIEEKACTPDCKKACCS